LRRVEEGVEKEKSRNKDGGGENGRKEAWHRLEAKPEVARR
jgi:hypothetical protein